MQGATCSPASKAKLQCDAHVRTGRIGNTPGTPRGTRSRQILGALLIGLNDLPKLGDFSRGDIYRD